MVLNQMGDYGHDVCIWLCAHHMNVLYLGSLCGSYISNMWVIYKEISKITVCRLYTYIQ